MEFVFLAILLLVILLGKRMYHTYINPLVLFLGVFFFAFFIVFSIDFIRVDLITGDIWVLYIASFISFFSGIILYRVVPIGFPKRKIFEIDEDAERKVYLKEIRTLFLLIFCATAIYWTQKLIANGVIGFFKYLLTTHENESIGGAFTIILYIKMLTVFLSPYVVNYMVQYKDRSIKYFLIIIFTFMANIAYTRNVLFYIAILDILVLLYTRLKENNRISFKWIFYVFVLVAAFRFFSYTQSLFNKQLSINGTFLGVKLSNPLVTIISYFTGPLVSTSLYSGNITNVPFLGYTLRCFRIIINGFGLKSLDTGSYMPQAWVYIPFKFNTTTLQLYILKEGGWVWVVLFFLFLGYISEKAYKNYRNNRSRYTLMLLILLSLLLITSIRSYIFTRLDMFIYSICVCVLVFLRRVSFGKKGGI